jgi:hypothetical protein
MNDEYAKGYDLGKAHAEHADRKKRPLTLAREILTNPVTFLSGTHSNEFQRGYHKGFEHAIQRPKVEIVNPPSSSTTTSNPNTIMPSIPGQIGLLQDLRGFLSQLQTALNNAATSYQRRVDALHAEGLIDDFHRDLSSECLSATTQEINQLVSNIEARDIPQVQEIISYLSSYRP